MSECQTLMSNLGEADLHMAVPDTCQTTVASQRFHRDASSFRMDTSCQGFQDLDTLLAVASCAVGLGDLHHLHTKPVLHKFIYIYYEDCTQRYLSHNGCFNLPLAIRSLTSPNTFKRHLKTYLFQLSYARCRSVFSC